MMRHLGLTFLSLALTFTLSPAFAQDATASMESSAPPYATAPVDRFYEVARGLYRGAAPTTLEQMKALKKMGIRTVINLQYDAKKVAWEAAAAKSLGMHHISIPLPGFGAPADKDVQRIQKLMNDPSVRPVLLHCTHGRERTGVQTALYRVFTEGWTPERAWAESEAFGFRWIAFPMKEYYENATGMK